MRLFTCPLAIMLLLLSAGTAVDVTLAQGLMAEHGRAYVETREALLERRNIVDVVPTTVQTTDYGPSTWMSLVLAEALAMHLTHSEEARHLRNLQGLNSDHYLLRRSQRPSAARELRSLRHVAPLLIELFLKGIETYEWSSPATAEAEEQALRRDLLMAIGRSDHPASIYFLMDVMEGGCACCASCNVVVSALGETGSIQALPVLLEVLKKARGDQNMEAYAAAVGALGRIPFVEVWPYLNAELDNPDPRLREVAVRSVGNYGSRWSWADKPDQGADIRATIGASLMDALSEEQNETVVVAILEGISGVATSRLRALLEQRQSTTTRSMQQSNMTQGRFQRAMGRINRTLERY